ncbi:hypothetical protein FH972_020726 [Carpinus fangiana]|uniref:AAA-type ATPase N-terminal domain-containing protein n=1 Tax=Carpinus fangiana TaxID=176857 RepID=A0A5N6RVM7_9ROSI|nr:hypothetical protein FH972_020726 [Carpinus fangiana]
MFSPKEMPSTASTLFSAYASFAATMMMVWSMANQIVPYELCAYLHSALNYLFTPRSSALTLVIDECCGMPRNQVYEAAEVYLRTKVVPATDCLRVSKTQRQKHISAAIEKGEEINDKFENFQVKWLLVCTVSETFKPNSLTLGELLKRVSDARKEATGDGNETPVHQV